MAMTDYLCADCGKAAAQKVKGLCIVCLGNKLALAEALNKSLVQFLKEGLSHSWDGNHWDGGDMQEFALELGLIKEAPDADQNEEFDIFYTYSDEVKAIKETGGGA